MQMLLQCKKLVAMFGSPFNAVADDSFVSCATYDNAATVYLQTLSRVVGSMALGLAHPQALALPLAARLMQRP